MEKFVSGVAKERCIIDLNIIGGDPSYGFEYLS